MFEEGLVYKFCWDSTLQKLAIIFNRPDLSHDCTNDRFNPHRIHGEIALICGWLSKIVQAYTKTTFAATHWDAIVDKIYKSNKTYY